MVMANLPYTLLHADQIRPDLIRPSQAKPDEAQPSAEIVGRIWATWSSFN